MSLCTSAHQTFYSPLVLFSLTWKHENLLLLLLLRPVNRISDSCTGLADVVLSLLKTYWSSSHSRLVTEQCSRVYYENDGTSTHLGFYIIVIERWISLSFAFLYCWKQFSTIQPWNTNSSSFILNCWLGSLNTIVFYFCLSFGWVLYDPVVFLFCLILFLCASPQLFVNTAASI